MYLKFSSALLFCSLFCFIGVPNESQAGKKKYPDRIAQLEFRDISVADALRILSEQSKMNIIASRQAAEIKMTLYLHDITPRHALEAMAKTYNLWYQKDPVSGVTRVYTVQEFRLGQVDYKNEKTKIYTFKHDRNALDFAYIIRDLYGFERVRLNFGANESDIIDDLSDRLERFDIIARNTLDSGDSGTTSSFGIDSNSGSNNSNNSGGGGNNNSRGGGNNRGNNSNNRNSNSGQNNNQRSNIPGQFGSLRQNEIVDSQKILPESESNALFSGNYSSGQNAMGEFIQRHSPIYVTMIRQQNRVLVRTRDQDVLNEVNDLYQQVDIEIATLLMEVKILEVNLSDDYTSIFDFAITNKNFNLTKGDENFSSLSSIRPNSDRNTENESTFESSSVNEGAANTLNEFTSTTTENISQTLGQITGNFVRGALGDPTLVAGLINDNFQARLQLLESEGRVTTLAAPMLTTTNQEVSRIFLGEERPITTDIDVVCPVVGDNSNIVGSVCTEDPQTAIRPIGRTLLLTPNINANGSVNIRILIEESEVCEKCGSIPTSTGTLEVDTVQPRTFSGSVIAGNGQTIAVGGLIQELSSDFEKKVPFLGDIPVLGTLFTDDIQSRSRKELVIIIRPFVMTNKEESKLTHNQWLKENSVHPSAVSSENMNIYSNQHREHQSYKLDKPYKEYKQQDKFDPEHWDKQKYYDKPAFNSQLKNGAKKTKKQQTYIALTKYAAKSVRLPINEREVIPTIVPTRLNNTFKTDLLYDSRLRAEPVASWHKGGVHVTAVQVYNTSNAKVEVDFRHMKGRWLSSSIENAKLTKLGEAGDSTYLYVVSAGAFEDVLR